jgi:hypothetical protein
VQDYLIGLDAKRWIEQVHENSPVEGVSFDDAANKLGIDAGWLRRKIEKFSELEKVKHEMQQAETNSMAQQQKG